jgi:hypothetical protein
MRAAIKALADRPVQVTVHPPTVNVSPPNVTVGAAEAPVVNVTPAPINITVEGAKGGGKKTVTFTDGREATITEEAA